MDDPALVITEDQFPLVIELDGVRRTLVEAARLLLNKPLGCVTALRDARHPTAYTLLRDAPLFAELRPVGRLDLDTSGLLFWTTEGAEVQRLAHPRRALPRTYEAALAGPFRAPSPGLTLDDGHRPQIVALDRLAPGAQHPCLSVPPEARELARITVAGGAYHEVRRIFAALGSHVVGLCRTGFGRLTLPLDLPPGAYRVLSGEALP
jgi:16S rRNA pseudouridine516 synthase